MNNLKLAARATQFASQMHSNQFRKHTGLPYIVHPMEVGVWTYKVLNNQLSITDLDNAVAAAILHDTIEDTSTTFEGLKLYFNEEVANLVLSVSKVSSKDKGTRAERKQQDLKHYIKGSFVAQTIKLCDIHVNSRDMFNENMEYAKKYIPEQFSLAWALYSSDLEFRSTVLTDLAKMLKSLNLT